MTKSVFIQKISHSSIYYRGSGYLPIKVKDSGKTFLELSIGDPDGTLVPIEVIPVKPTISQMSAHIRGGYIYRTEARHAYKVFAGKNYKRATRQFAESWFVYFPANLGFIRDGEIRAVFNKTHNRIDYHEIYLYCRGIHPNTGDLIEIYRFKETTAPVKFSDKGYPYMTEDEATSGFARQIVRHISSDIEDNRRYALENESHAVMDDFFDRNAGYNNDYFWK